MNKTRCFAAIAAFACAALAPAAFAAGNACIVPDLGMGLAGDQAIDCGIATSGKRAQRARVATCARKAIADSTPVRFGVGTRGVDAFTCDVVVMDADKRFWLVTYDWSAGDDKPTAFVGRCGKIDPDWRDATGQDHFGPRECVADADALERAAIRRP